MAVQVICDQCGTDNRLGTLFCRECGTRLDLTKVKGPGSRSAGNPASWLARIIRLVITLSLLVTLGLLCWPAEPGGDAPAAAGNTVLPRKVNALRHAAQRGNAVTEEISEAEINGYLNARLVKAGAGTGWQLRLREVRVDIKPEGIRVWMRSDLGPLPVTYTAITRMERAADRRHAFFADQVMIGHLPMVGPLRDRTLNQMIGVFSVLGEELRFLNDVGRTRLLDGALELSTAR